MEDGSPRSRSRDDLEITSIGTLYSGSWDKKYWSSSRGKDRYPYPVGYRALRTHGGSTYQMEIHEGAKGPIFEVTSADGDSSTGQTPEIAWEHFQKKNGPRFKNGNGKRFSSKVDGVELFGFRNPYVQRLLREIVSNVYKVAESDVLSAPLGNEAPRLDNKIQARGFFAHNDLPVYTEKDQTTRKRSTMNKICKVSSKAAKNKRSRCQYVLNDSRAADPHQENVIFSRTESKNGEVIKENSIPLSRNQTFQIQGSQNHINYLPKGNNCVATNDTCFQAGKNCKTDSNFRNKDGEDLEILSGQVSAVPENFNHFSAIDDLTQEMRDPDNSIVKHVIYVKNNSASQDPNLTCVNNTCDVADGMLDLSPSARLNPLGALSEATEKNSNVCVSDACGALKCAGAGCASVRENPCNTQQITSTCLQPAPEHSSLPDTAASKELIKDSLSETVSSSDSSNPSSDKADLSKAGEELAKSMMCFLLPRAVPLLKKTYVKRKSRRQSQEIQLGPHSTLSISSAEEKIGSEQHSTGNTCHGDFEADRLMNKPKVKIPETSNDPLSMPYQRTKMEHPNEGCMIYKPFDQSEYVEDAKHVIPDSFEDGKYVCNFHVEKPTSVAYEIEGMAYDKNIENNITSNPVIVQAERVEPSDSDIAVLPKETEKSDYFLTDSLIHCLEEALNDDLFFGEANVSDAICSLGVCADNNMPYLNPAVVKNDVSQILNTVHGEDALEEMVIPEYTLDHNNCRDGNAKCLEQRFPAANTSSNNLGERETSVFVIEESSHMNAIHGEEFQTSTLNDLVEFEILDTTEHKDCKLRDQIGAIHPSTAGLNGESLVNMKGDSASFSQMQNILPSDDRQQVTDSIKMRMLSNTPHFPSQCNVPLSESIICRNYNDFDTSETNYAPKKSEIAGNNQARPIIGESNTSVVSQYQDLARNVDADVQCPNFDDHFVDYVEENCADSMNKIQSSDQFCIPPFQESLKQSKDVPDQSINVLEDLSFSVKKQTIGATIEEKDTNLFHEELNQNDQLDGSSCKHVKSNKELGRPFELAGCYMHPNQVLSMCLRSKDDYLQISVICGLPESNERYLFIYKTPLKEKGEICPSFIGYTLLVLPLFPGPSNGNTTFERSGLQFTPDAQYLVFLNTIKVPLCRVGRINCKCSMCTFDHHEENVVRIGRVNFGYVLPLAKLTTIERLSCILVSEPNYLIAAGVSGTLHVWLMTCDWSGASEEFALPSFNYFTPAIELKTIPKANYLIIGHNGVGSFGLWDISKRVLLARSSIAGNLIFQILPIGFFSFKDETVHSACQEIKLMKETLKANDWVIEAAANPLQLREDTAVWLLVSTTSDLEEREDHQLKGLDRDSNRCWRLALLVKNIIVMGSVLDYRASSADASADYGIIGTYDGLLYTWELSTGKKLANLFRLKRGSIFCTAVDAESGVLAVADDKCRLLIFKQV